MSAFNNAHIIYIITSKAVMFVDIILTLLASVWIYVSNE